MKSYVLTFAALLALTGLTFGLSFAPLGSWGVPVAITIAATKAILIALFFMHLLDQRTPAHIATSVAVLLVILLIVLATLDVATRPAIDGPGTPRPVPEQTTP